MRGKFFSHSKGTRIGVVSFARRNQGTREDDSQVGEEEMQGQGVRGRQAGSWRCPGWQQGMQGRGELLVKKLVRTYLEAIKLVMRGEVLESPVWNEYGRGGVQ